LSISFVNIFSNVGIIATCIWISLLGYIYFKYFNGRTSYTRLVYGILFACAAGIAGGIAAGYYFQQAWYFELGNCNRKIISIRMMLIICMFESLFFLFCLYNFVCLFSI
jgi:hypothetical protein